MAADVLRSAVRALADTRLRTSLTVAGIAIGIAALFSLLSIAEGIRTRIVNKWLASGLMTSLTVLPHETMNHLRHQYGERSQRGLLKREPSEERRALDDAAVGAISRIEGVRRAWPVISRLVMLDSEPTVAPPDSPGVAPSETSTFATLRGFDTDFFWGEDYMRITAGRPLADPEAREALLSEDRLEDLGYKDATAALGKTVTIRWRELAAPGTIGAQAVPGFPFSVAPKAVRYRIAGVFERRGALSLRSAGIIIPTEQARSIPDPAHLRSLFEGGAAAAGYPGLDVYLAPGADLEAIESKIKKMGFATISGAEIVGQIRRSILVLQSVLGGLGTIAISVATLGIANTLLTAVYERMREIGVMKAVGARRRDIRRQFFAEAGMIGFIGGVAGVILGFCGDHILGVAIGHIVRRQGGDDPGALAVHTPLIALGCLAFSVLLSLVAGTFPAMRAARLDPVQTLRHE